MAVERCPQDVIIILALACLVRACTGFDMMKPRSDTVRQLTLSGGWTDFGTGISARARAKDGFNRCWKINTSSFDDLEKEGTK